jgi:hypothetical protein
MSTLLRLSEENKGVFEVNENSDMLVNQTLMSKQMRAHTKQVQAMSMGQVQAQQAQVQ